ncbi:MAG: hypothetical protein M3Q97_10150, partial [Bacteroidota bacterium]|nr:hypothetical protein [Bacteroidota bacterium]
LEQLSDTVILATFPKDLKFDLFCYFVNYLHYPNNVFYKAEITGWTTVKKGSPTVPDELSGQTVMISIPDGDKEYTYVVITGRDGSSFKLSFENMKTIKWPNTIPWHEPKINKAVPETSPAEEIR